MAVFGGGEVALRKASFFGREAEVTVISRSFCPGFSGFNGKLVAGDALESIEEWVDWADMVIATTDSRGVNEAVACSARKRGKPCNRADGVSSFLIPSVIDRRNFTVAVSTLGRSPAMSKHLKSRLESALSPRDELMVDLQEKLRAVAKARISSQRTREEFLWRVLGDQRIWKALDEGQAEALRISMELMGDYIGNDLERSYNA